LVAELIVKGLERGSLIALVSLVALVIGRWRWGSVLRTKGGLGKADGQNGQKDKKLWERFHNFNQSNGIICWGLDALNVRLLQNFA
jgi:hypothetical protein